VSLTQDTFRRACGHFATGVAILATRTPDGTPHGLTVNSFASLSLDPPMVMAAIAHTSNQLAAFDSAPSFSINILSEEQLELSKRFARVHEDRFKDVPWIEGTLGAPLLEGSIASIECQIIHRIDVGDHRVLIGEAVDARVRAGRPLLYFRSAYAALA
jgi:flavin reductase (DIM6/NTAB) family NADH-FMN oxidoreductase RutF